MVLKRIFDVIVSVVALILLLPVFFVVMILVRIKLGSPIFFRQVRPGKDGKPFEMIKFRTMLNAYDEYGKPLPNDLRMTSFGKKLRSTSLDELPELWNVLKGDMSLVGPRPLLVEYIELYSSEQARRHEMRPGVTGWAQVNGRNSISWDEKFKLDVWYVDNQSFLLDIRILFMTVFNVFRREGITHKGDVAMPKFTGTKTTKDM